MDFLGLLLEKVRDERRALAENMANGCCRDFSEYRRLVGLGEGLLWVEQQIVDLNRRIDEA